ncbi:HNH endonuclease [Psychroserpens luteolus]|uniref:HNH endonuclease n=1 Tax=Psychroserpens luteolus TaxID=2855840 RepID=UPI001E2F0442|nr:hypothetical protein [Psychroserpens luteolus]MCD2260209.1 hypothetical protein [Psychroserpens luteolus]
MINILTNKTKYALQIHTKGLKDEIIKRAQSRYDNSNTSLSRLDYRILLTFIKGNSQDIISKELTGLRQLQNRLFNLLPNSQDLEEDLEYIFNYKLFRKFKKIKYNGFRLAKNLNIEVCPYCNRNYTTSHRVDGESKNVYPEFDHYLPRSTYPLLALSFYNLIPSCNICNTHYKGSEDPLVRNLYYPYSNYEAIKYFNFGFTPSDSDAILGKSNNLSIDIETAKYSSTPLIRLQVDNSLNFFNILEIYTKNHKALIMDVINKRITYSDNYIKQLENNYGLTFEDAYRVIFETYYEETKLMKRPFSKLKRDIFIELKELT